MRRRFVPSLGLAVAAAFAFSDAAFASPTTTTFQISHRDNDYKESSSGSSTRLDSTHDLWVAGDSLQGYRFTSVTVPKDAVILEARMQVYATSNGTSADLSGFARGEASGNSHAWTGTNYEITNTTKTAASTRIEGIPAWTANAHNDVAKVTTIVQEIVNRSDWSSGNALTIFLIASSFSDHRRTSTYDSASSKAAKLIVTYVTAPTCGAAAVLELTPTGSLTAFDLGWTGAGHDGPVSTPEAKLTFLTDCHDTSAPCTDCDLAELIRNPDGGLGSVQNQRCTHDSSVHCTADGQCSALQGGSTCRFYLGAPSPVAGPQVTACSTSYVSGAVDGNVDPTNGDLAIALPLTTRLAPFQLHLSGLPTADACPRCTGDLSANDGVAGGTCSSGPRSGLACDANGAGNPFFGDTSLDCPQSTVDNTTTVTTFGGTTTNDSRELVTGTSPACGAAAPGKLCFCSLCNDAGGTVCASNADCPSGRTCGGKRCSGGSNANGVCTVSSACPGGTCVGPSGAPPKPNACTDGVCTAVGANGGVCEAGPSEQFCGPSAPARYAPCFGDGDCTGFGVCSQNPSVTCTSSNIFCTCILDTCQSELRQCYPDNGVNGGEVEAIGEVSSTPTSGSWTATIQQLGCAGPGGVTGVNDALGLPGLARFELPMSLKTRP